MWVAYDRGRRAAAKGGGCGGWAGLPEQRKVYQRQVDLREPLLGAARWQSDQASARTDEGNVMIGCYTTERKLNPLPPSYSVTLWFAAGNSRARRATRRRLPRVPRHGQW